MTDYSVPFSRLVEFSPAFDKRDPDPSKNYGVGSVQIRFVLKGAHGAVQALFGTNWNLPHVQPSIDGKVSLRGWGLAYHADSRHPIRDWYSDTQLYDGKGEKLPTTSTYECSYTESGRCFYDGSTLNAERLVDILLCEGSEGIWLELEWYYEAVFRKHVDNSPQAQ